MSQWWDPVPGEPSRRIHCRQARVSVQRSFDALTQPTMECGVPAEVFFRPVRVPKSTYPPLAETTQEFEAKSSAFETCPEFLVGTEDPLNTPSLPLPEMSFTTLPEVSSKFQYPTNPPHPIHHRRTVHVPTARSSSSYWMAYVPVAVTRSTETEPKWIGDMSAFRTMPSEFPRRWGNLFE